MDQINVQRWANSLRQFHQNCFQPPIVTDGCVGSDNGARNASTTVKVRENESPNDNQKYTITLDLTSSKKYSNRILKSQFYTFDMTTKDEETLPSSTNAQLSVNHTSNLLTPSPDHPDMDALSDAGTYIIEDDDSEQKLNPSSFKRYVNQTKSRHGTFDIHGLISSTAHTIHRPVVDSNISKHDLSSSSSNSSLLSFPNEEIEDTSENKSSLHQQSSTPQNQIKSPESFVISPIFETKSFPMTNNLRQKVEAPLKSKSLSTKDPNLEIPMTQSNSSSLSTHSDQKSATHLRKQSPSIKTSARPHTATNDQPSSFQRNSTIRQTTPEKSQYQRQTSSLSTIDNNEIIPNSTKVYMNKSFALRQQHSNLIPSTAKPIQQQITSSSRQPLKATTSVPSSIINSNSQTNRAVELRRARAQAKIEELSQRTRKQFHKPNHQNDIMSASWHSNTNKKDLTNLRTNILPQKQDLSKTRTISSSSRESSSRYRNDILSNVTDGQQYHKMNTSTNSSEGERCDSLRDNGQRLAIKLIQLSSGILEKLKPNDVVSVRELEQLVDKLQTVNRTLSSIDASLTGSTNDNTFV